MINSFSLSTLVQHSLHHLVPGLYPLYFSLPHGRPQKVSKESPIFSDMANGFPKETSTCCYSFVPPPSRQDKLLSPLGVQQLWLNLCKAHISGLHIFGCSFSLHIFSTGTAQQNQRNNENYLKKKLIWSSARRSEICSYFVVGANA